MILVRALFLGAFVCLLPLQALSQANPYAYKPGLYQQYRNLSGLAGAGFGVDQDGYHSIGGPIAFSSPTADVLGHGHWQLSYGSESYDSHLRIDESTRTNDSLFAIGGVTLGRVNISGTFFVKSRALDQVFNLQVGYKPTPKIPLTVSLGVQNIQDRGAIPGEGAPGDNSSRSIFGVMTYRLDTRKNPVYISAGYGSNRFNGIFGSVSYQIVRRVRIYAEDDTFGINFGAALGWKTGHGRSSAIIEGLLGYVKTHPVFSLGFGF